MSRSNQNLMNSEIKMSIQRCRTWVFTLNNYTQEEEEGIMESECADYIVFGREVGEEGTPHLQGYLEFSEPLKMSQVKKRMKNTRLHLEARRGTQKQAIDYCKKDGDVFEKGTPKKSARDESKADEKNKTLQYMELLKKGKLGEIASDPDCSFNIFKHCREIAALMEEPRDVNVPINVRWYWGPTGTGKTRRAYYEASQLGKVYIKSTSTKWFDGYDGEEVIIFDDLRSSWFEYSYLLKLLDRYPTQVECKGGSRQWKAVHVFVTSPFEPKGMYAQMQERDTTDSIEQLVRRVHVCEHMPMTPFGCWTEACAKKAGFAPPPEPSSSQNQP